MNPKLKYWILTSEFPPLFGGGIGSYCIETANMLFKYGYEVAIITQDFKVNQLTEKQESNYKIVKFNPNKYYTRSFLGYEANLSFAFAEAVNELMIKYGTPDVLESQEYNGIAYFLLQRKHLSYELFKDLRVIITLHAPSFLYLEYNKVSTYQFPYFWTGEMERFCIRAADLIISPSQYLISELSSRMSLEDIKINILNNPYEVNWEYKQTKIQKNKIVFLGKLTPQKGCLELLQYFSKLWNNDFSFPLYMIGGGNHRYHPEGIDMIDFIKQKYKHEIKNEKLILLGSISPDKINSYIEDAHVIIIPSIVDNLPYTVLESMGRGKIVLASTQGGQSEIIENEIDGFLFSHNISNSFENQIMNILSLSDENINTIAKKAFDKIKSKYSHDNIFNLKNDLIQKLINQKIESNIFPYIRPILSNNTNLANCNINNPLLTIIVPYYNMGKYIDETITSILNSRYKNIEILIVNDGSNEAISVAKLKNYENFKQIKIIHKENEGLSLARNDGAKNANGDFIAFLDPDDTVEPSYYEKSIKILTTKENVFFVGCWAKYFGNSNDYWPTFNPEPPYLLLHNMINSSALVFKKDVFLKSGLNNPKLIYGMEDYDSVINMVKSGFHGVALPEPLWNYRIRKKSMARLFTKEKKIYLYRLIANNHKDFFTNFATDVNNLLNANGSCIDIENPTLNYSFLNGNKLISKIKQKIITKAKTSNIIRSIAIFIFNLYKKA